MKRTYISLCAALALTSAMAQTDTKLNGTVIGTATSINYSTNQRSTTVNTRDMAFDGNLDTYFASYDRSLTWCGLDLGSKHVITRVGWAPRNDEWNGSQRVVLAVFEGANNPDFSDAVPLYINSQPGTIGQVDYADVNVSRAFRYVRYVGPNNARCNVAEVEFYGHPGEGDDSQFYRPSRLPLVYIQIENAAEPTGKTTADELNCQVTLIPASSTDTIKTKEATIRLRGNNSMSYDKKPYRIKFEKKHHVFGSPASARKWTLINSHGDKTLMRNALAFEVSRRMGMEYTPYCQPVDVVVNGEYKGCYQLCDQVEVKKNRVPVEEMTPEDNSGDALTGGYLIEVDDYANGEPNHFTSSRGTRVTVKYPDSDDITSQQNDYIKNMYNKLENSVFYANFASETYGYRQYLDLDAFLRRFLAGELTGNTDNYWSMYLYKKRGDDHLIACPLWDNDLAFDNDNRTHYYFDGDDWIYPHASNTGAMASFVTRIVKVDNAAIEQMRQLWHDARRAGLSATSLNNYVEHLRTDMRESTTLNFTRWPILNQYIHQNFQALGSWDAEVDYVKEYITSRIDWMDNKLGYVPSTLTGDVNGDGVIDVTDVNIIINIMLGSIPLSDYPAADINGDTQVDVTDVNLAINTMLSK